MMKSRGAAVIAAFALIALALFVRGLLTDDEAGGSDGPKKGDGGDVPVVACTPELVAVCDALADDGQIAADPPVLDLGDAAAPADGIDGWITWDPAPEVANFDAGQSPTWGPSEALGSAPLAALAEGEVFGGLRSSCTDVDWSCFARRGDDWGVTFGVGDPSTAEGLARLAPLAVGLSPDLDTAELEASDLRAIVDSSVIGQADAVSMSLSATRPGQISLVVGPQALLEQRADSPQGKGQRLQAEVLDPELAATVVLAERTGHDLGDLAEACEDDAVADALTAVGVDPCSDGRDDVDRAGFLYNVREKAS